MFNSKASDKDQRKTHFIVVFSLLLNIFTLDLGLLLECLPFNK